MIKKLLISLLLVSTAFGQFWTQPTQKPWLGLQVNYGHPLSKGLVGLWLMNENSGDKVQDLSGNGNSGTLAGTTPVWTPGKYGPALDFNGGYVDIGDIDGIAGRSLTIVAHIYVDDLTGDERGIVTQWSSDSVTRIFNFRVEKTGALAFYTCDGFTITSNKTTTGIITTGKWYSVAMSFNSTNQKARFYVGGVYYSNAGQDDNLHNLRDGSDLLNIGAAEDANQDNFDGRISHVIIYRHNPDFFNTESEIQQFYSNPFCMFQEVFPVWWYAGIGEAPATSIPIFMYHYMNH